MHYNNNYAETPPPTAGGSRIDARVHCAVLKKRTTASPAPRPGTTPRPGRQQPARAEKTRPPHAGRRFPQDPTACPPRPRPPGPPFRPPALAGNAY